MQNFYKHSSVGAIRPSFDPHQCPGRRYVKQIDSAAILAAKRLAGIAPEVDLKECITHTPPPSVNKACPL